jgi:hypothetical protein
MKKLLMMLFVTISSFAFASGLLATPIETVYVTSDVQSFDSEDFPGLTDISRMIIAAIPENFPGDTVSVNSSATGSINLMPFAGWEYWIRTFDSPPIGDDWEIQYSFQSGEDTAELDLTNCQISPLNVPQNVTINGLKIDWDNVSGADYYRLRWFGLDNDGNPNFSEGPVAETDLFTSSEYVMSNPLPGVYALRVEALQECTEGVVVNKSSFNLLQKISSQPIPTLSEWGMILFSLLLGSVAIWYLRKKSQISPMA